MAKPVMQIQGLQELREAFEKSPELLKNRIAPRVARATFAATNGVRTTAPRDTGKLQAAISSSVRPLTGRVLIDDAAYYWRMVEFGTIYQNARPFVRTTFEREAPNFERDMEDAAEHFARDFSASRFL